MSVSLQFVLSRGEVEDHMDTHSCTDHSILAIFEDSAVPSEVSVTAYECERVHIDIPHVRVRVCDICAATSAS